MCTKETNQNGSTTNNNLIRIGKSYSRHRKYNILKLIKTFLVLFLKLESDITTSRNLTIGATLSFKNNSISKNFKFLAVPVTSLSTINETKFFFDTSILNTESGKFGVLDFGFKFPPMSQINFALNISITITLFF